MQSSSTRTDAKPQFRFIEKLSGKDSSEKFQETLKSTPKKLKILLKNFSHHMQKSDLDFIWNEATPMKYLDSHGSAEV